MNLLSFEEKNLCKTYYDEPSPVDLPFCFLRQRPKLGWNFFFFRSRTLIDWDAIKLIKKRKGVGNAKETHCTLKKLILKETIYPYGLFFVSVKHKKTSMKGTRQWLLYYLLSQLLHKLSRFVWLILHVKNYRCDLNQEDRYNECAFSLFLEICAWILI